MANPFSKMGDLIKLQREAKRVQQELRKTEVESVSGGGNIKFMINGETQVTSVEINEEILKAENKKLIEDSLKETLNAGIKKAQAEAAEKTKDLMGKLNLPM